MSRSLILVVDDEANVRKVLSALLEQAGHATARAADGREALELVRSQDPDLVLTDLQMPHVDGLELLAQLRDGFPEIPVILLTAHGTVETAVEAMKRGAHDFLTKPFEKEAVLASVDKALGQAERARQDVQGRVGEEAPDGIVGSSPAMVELNRLIHKVAPSPTTVLVTGETGTGKELVATAIHGLSDRKGGPFVSVNCGALPETLVESELFGHEKGAFSGAERSKPGRFELADGGVLFLDEVGELEQPVQVKLLRVLQERQVDRLGGTRPRPVDVRLVAATNRDLAAEVEAGRFREDLYYRLQVVELRVPPLRERLEDLPALVEFFLDLHAARLQRDRPRVSESALAALSAQAWKGNVRELANAVERAVLLADEDELGPSDFGLGPAEGTEAGGAAPSEAATGDLKEAARAAAAQAERRLITEALEETGGNVTRAAERLGLSRRGLQLKMKQLDLR